MLTCCHHGLPAAGSWPSLCECKQWGKQTGELIQRLNPCSSWQACSRMLTVLLSAALRQGAHWVLYAVRLLDARLGSASPSCLPSCVLAAGVLHWLCISVGQVNYPKVADSSSFDEDSSDALSPEQPASHESQGSVPSPLESRVSDPLPSATSISPTQVSLLLLDSSSHLPRLSRSGSVPGRWAVPAVCMRDRCVCGPHFRSQQWTQFQQPEHKERLG